ncbi:MAG: hypothetical protein V3T22_05820, partial [Planctomycetota bacterium]
MGRWYWESVLTVALGAILCSPLQAASCRLPSLWGVHHAQRTADGERVHDVLLELDRLTATLVGPSDIARAIEQKGPAWTPALIQLLEHGRSPDRPLSLPERRVLLAALAAWGRRSTMPFVRERALLEGDARAWEALLLILGEVGHGSDLEFVSQIGAKELTGPRLPARVGEALREASAKILSRDPRSMYLLRELLLSSDPRIGILLAGAVGDSAPPTGAESLSRLLGFVPFSDRSLLESIGRAGRELPHPVDSSITDAVRLYLHSEDLGLVRETALTLGVLGDHDAIGSLTRLLDHHSLSVRSASHAALVQITGLGFSADAARWNSWYNLESAWLDERARVL